MRELQAGNLYRDVPQRAEQELFSEIATALAVRIERIVSAGQATPEGEWYDQDTDEWVLVLQGRARLGFADGRGNVDLAPGDHVLIPAHCRHRVDWTADDEPTIWLAVHYAAAGPASTPPERRGVTKS
jgi:cupin 2 domain-containing protein